MNRTILYSLISITLLHICTTSTVPMVFFKKNRNATERPLGNPEHRKQLQITGSCVNCDLRGFNITEDLKIYETHYGLLSSLFFETINAPKEPINLSGSNLTGAYCVGANFQNGIFLGTKFVQADLSHVQGQRANFGFAHFDEADLNHANLTNANLGSANLSETNLTNARLVNAHCKDATFNQALLEDADLSNAQLQSAGFSGTNCIRANFTNANLTDAILENTTFLKANLTNALLQNAIITNASFAGTNLENTNFRNAIISATLFKGKNAKKARFIPRELR